MALEKSKITLHFNIKLLITELNKTYKKKKRKRKAKTSFSFTAHDAVAVEFESLAIAVISLHRLLYNSDRKASVLSIR